MSTAQLLHLSDISACDIKRRLYRRMPYPVQEHFTYPGRNDINSDINAPQRAMAPTAHLRWRDRFTTAIGTLLSELRAKQQYPDQKQHYYLVKSSVLTLSLGKNYDNCPP